MEIGRRILSRWTSAGRATTARLILAVFAGTAMAWFGCALPFDGDGPDDPNEPVSFARDIVPIFQANCAGCHDPGGSSGIVLRLSEEAAYEELVNRHSVQAPELIYIVPGDPQNSLLYLKVSRDDPPVGLRMPRFAPPLTTGEIAMIEEWIADGAPDN